jgi:hypothetical protein
MQEPDRLFPLKLSRVKGETQEALLNGSGGWYTLGTAAGDGDERPE